MIVVGAGIMGSCAAYAASSRGARVLLLERFDLLHHRGSSHGESRTIRATYPQAHYPPMVRLSRRLWDEAQADAGYAVLTPTPHLDLGPADDPALVAAIRNGGATEVALAAAAAGDDESASASWPWAGVFRVPDGWTAAPSELGGVMKATKAVAMFQALAVKKGAVLRDRAEVVDVTTSSKRGEGERALCLVHCLLPRSTYRTRTNSLGSMRHARMRASLLHVSDRDALTSHWQASKQARWSWV